MRGVVLAAAVVFFAGTVGAQPAETFTSTEGKYAAKFPGKPKVAAAQTTRSAIGDLQVNVATYATADANVYVVSYTDFPPAAVKAENRGTLFDGVRDTLDRLAKSGECGLNEPCPDGARFDEAYLDRRSGKLKPQDVIDAAFLRRLAEWGHRRHWECQRQGGCIVSISPLTDTSCSF